MFLVVLYLECVGVALVAITCVSHHELIEGSLEPVFALFVCEVDPFEVL